MADMIYFLLITLLIIVFIGNIMYMLQLNVTFGVESESDNLIEPIFGLPIFDAPLNQYMLMLGEFNMDGFRYHENKVSCYLIFLFSTFITQITFLNMLIAIMGDTFDRVISKKSLHSTKNKLELMTDMISVTKLISRKRNENEDKIYFYLIQPKNNYEDLNEDDDNWQGRIQHQQNFIKH